MQIHEKHEAVACIQMAVITADAELKALEETDNEYKSQKNTKVVLDPVPTLISDI